MKHARGAAPLLTLIDGRYRIERELGVGGSGVVYEGLHVGLGSKVAVKLLQLPAELSEDQQKGRVADFLEEARTLTRLKHPSIVTAVDLGVVQLAGVQHPYFVMELCAGRSLRDFLEENDGLGLKQAWQLFEPLVRATAFAHKLGVVHRDIKPGNVMLDVHPEDGRLVPKLIDFGVSKAVALDAEPGTGSTKTTSGSSPHTPAYAAPEQIAGGRTGPWTDVHALGLLFIEMITGEPPYGYDEPRMHVIDVTRPSAATCGVNIGAFEQVISGRALALRPQDRFRDAGELLTALLAAAQTEGFETTSQAAGAISRVPFDQTVNAAASPSPNAGGLSDRVQPTPRSDISSAETVVAPETLVVVGQTALAGQTQLETEAPAASRRGRVGLLVATLAVVCVVGVVGVGAWRSAAASRVAPETPASLSSGATEQADIEPLRPSLSWPSAAALPSGAPELEPSASPAPSARATPSSRPTLSAGAAPSARARLSVPPHESANRPPRGDPPPADTTKAPKPPTLY